MAGVVTFTLPSGSRVTCEQALAERLGYKAPAAAKPTTKAQSK